MLDTLNAIFLQSDFDPMGGMKFIHLEDFLGLIIRLSVHMLFVVLLVRGIYYPIAKRKDFLFTYLLFSLTIFLMCFMLESVKLQMGFALGLFAVFGIIRYRTDAIPIKEMTYLFVVIYLFNYTKCTLLFHIFNDHRNYQCRNEGIEGYLALSAHSK